MGQEAWFWILGGILSVISVVGNGGVILLITARRRLHTTANYFILSLAVADFFIGTTYLPLNKLKEVYSDSKYRRNICFQVELILCGASVINLCVMTLDRYIRIAYPLRYNTYMTPRRVGLLIIAASVMVLIRLSLRLKEEPEDRINGTVYIIDTVLYHIIPCIALLLATIHILLIVRRHSKQTAALLAQLRHNYPLSSPQERNPPHRETASNQTHEAASSRVLLAVVIVFILCYGSIAVLKYTQVMLDLVHILIITNSTVNPFAYAFFKTDIKREMRMSLCCLKDNQTPPF